ncbi:MAG: winged helix-turn-helix transcriptional regulator [Candidatus Devosia euplotis]|nr:winged helix-turn-helix transcriptional regulator [Candidatus Devosia euplotis]
MRYNALLQLVAPIAAKELTRNLRELEYAGLAPRRQQSDMPDGLYAPTELGKTLEQTFRALGEFGTAYLLSRRSMHSKPE